MRVNKDKWKVKDSDFGPLLKYIKDENVTDVNYNGESVWIDDLTRGRYCAEDVKLSKDFIECFTTRIADAVSESFNPYYPLLEAETETLRVSIVHEEYANTGRSISIRKTPIIRRLTREKMLDENYCSAEFLDFMEQCVNAKMNMLMCGPPGTGKTEFLKYLTNYIPSDDRVITIEDNLEIHYAKINPGKDCVELKVDEKYFSYVTAIKACLRQNPQWILLSEARSTEVKYLLESMSTGTHCLTTLHTDDVRKVPDRIKNMVQDSVIAARIENDVFAFLDAAILIKKKTINGKIHRYIDQMCFFSREENDENKIVMVVEDGKFINKNLPQQIMNKFAHAGIFNPLGNSILLPSENETKTLFDSRFIPESTDNYHEHVEQAHEIKKATAENMDDNALAATKNTVDEIREGQAPEEAQITNEQEAENKNASEANAENLTPELDDEVNETTELPVMPDTKQDAVSDKENKEVKPTPSEEDFCDNLLDYSYSKHALDDAARLRRAQRNKR